MSDASELEQSDSVVITDDSDYFHRSHPSALLHLACNPDVKGSMARLSSVEDDRTPCNHVSCFGEP